MNSLLFNKENSHMRAIHRLMSVPEEARDLPWLKEALQAAIQLELSTIPPYLYAYWSITGPDPNRVASTIREIAIEEMQHLGIACNLLASIGGQPNILAAVSTYPATLPKDIHRGLSVPLAGYSRETILRTFMVIEEPQAHLVDDPDFLPTGSTLIGDFYDSVQAEFESHAPNPLLSAKQVSLAGLGFDIDSPFVIASLGDMRDAIGLIKRQGEGGSNTPFETGTQLAHFYQFGEIFHGQRLKKIQDTPPKFSYSGDSVTPPPDTTLPIAGAESAAFNLAYSNMLRKLQSAWDLGGDPGASALANAVGSGMGRVDTEARTLVGTGKGPAFLLVDASGAPVPEPGTITGNRYHHVLEILDQAVNGGTFGAHGPFWRGKTRDQFVQLRVFGQPLLVVGNGRDSNIVKALRGLAPFGRDTGTAGANFRRMPAGRPPVPPASIDFIESWIADGCPDEAPPLFAPSVSLTTGSQRPDPQIHVAFWRDFDDWAMYHATTETQDAIGEVFGFFDAWKALARNPSAATESQWSAALQAGSTRAAVAMLSSRQKQTVESHYGTPVPLLTVLDGFERFGNDGLPDDPLRPEDPRHNMNGEIMWFIWSGFADACLHLDISADFWRFYMRSVLCGLLNDGVYRGRFHVNGFTAVPDDHLRIFTHCQNVADADLPAELRRRYVESGL